MKIQRLTIATALAVLIVSGLLVTVAVFDTVPVYGETFRERAEAGRAHDLDIWETVQRHSAAYVEALDLTEEDVRWLERTGHSKDQLEGAGPFGVALYVEHVCGAPYGGPWVDLVQAKPRGSRWGGGRPGSGRFKHAGGGTSYISVLDEDLHKKLVAALRGR